MTRLALCLLLLATGASADPIVLERFIPSGLSRYDDVERGVTCWITGMGSGISCLPMQDHQAGNQRQLSPHEQEDNSPTPAAAQGRWIDERYEL